MTENVHRQENITRPWLQHLPKISERNVEDRKPMQHRSPIRTPNVTVVPPLYQLVLVAATEGSMFHVIVTAADCDGRTTVKSGEYNSNAEHSDFSSSSLCSSSLASYTSIRLVCYNTYTRLNFIRNIHKLTLDTKTREERCAS